MHRHRLKGRGREDGKWGCKAIGWRDARVRNSALTASLAPLQAAAAAVRHVCTYRVTRKQTSRCRNNTAARSATPRHATAWARGKLVLRTHPRSGATHSDTCLPWKHTHHWHRPQSFLPPPDFTPVVTSLPYLQWQLLQPPTSYTPA